MKNTCMKWKDQLLEAALTGTSEGELRDHLSRCADCTTELAALRARRERLDTLLPLVASAEEPSPGLHTRILHATAAATQRQRFSLPRLWVPVTAAVIMIAVMIGWVLNRRNTLTQAELHGAQALAQWRAPSDVLLQMPGQEFLNSAPRLGESYIIEIPTEKERGGTK